MRFTVLIPARLASTRLPNKPLADIGGQPMVVRVARQAAQSAAQRVVVAADSQAITEACKAHGVEAVLTGTHHLSGSDRLAQACDLLGLADDEVVVNVQGDEPLIAPALINQVAALLNRHPQASMGTAAHPVQTLADFLNPNVVKVVLDAQGQALYFSRAPIPYPRDASLAPQTDLPTAAAATGPTLNATDASWLKGQPLRHIGLYSYRAAFLRRFPALQPAPLELTESLEQLRVLWHGLRIAVHVTQQAPASGVDTPEDLARIRRVFTAF
ncbi:MAG: 3-deoxy-manno-octulosonate cytidylyltransferase [Burkholderiales bacterium]